MRLRLAYSIIFLTLGYSLYGQVKSNRDAIKEVEEDYVLPKDSLDSKNRINYNFEAGLNVSSDGSFSTFYRPSISYEVSPNFAIRSGILYRNGNMNYSPLLIENNGDSPFRANLSQYSAFIQGNYRLSDKLSVGGSIYYDIFTSYNTSSQTSVSPDLNNFGYSASFEYRVNEKITFSGEIRVREGNIYNPFNRNQEGNFNSFFSDSYGFPYRTW